MALVLGGVVLALVVAGLPLGAMAHQLDLPDQSGGRGFPGWGCGGGGRGLAPAA
jgi:hypothetical protein